MTGSNHPVHVLRRLGDVPLNERFCVLDTPQADGDGLLYFGGKQVPQGSIALPLHCQAYYTLGAPDTGTYNVHVSLPFGRIDVGPDGTTPAVLYVGRSAEGRSSYAVPLAQDEYDLEITSGVARLGLRTVWLDDADRRALELMQQNAENWASRPSLGTKSALPNLQSLRDFCAQVTPVTADTADAIEVPATYVNFYQWLVGVYRLVYREGFTDLKTRQMLLGLFTGSTSQLLRAATVSRYMPIVAAHAAAG